MQISRLGRKHHAEPRGVLGRTSPGASWSRKDRLQGGALSGLLHEPPPGLSKCGLRTSRPSRGPSMGSTARWSQTTASRWGTADSGPEEGSPRQTPPSCHGEARPPHRASGAARRQLPPLQSTKFKTRSCAEKAGETLRLQVCLPVSFQVILHF